MGKFVRYFPIPIGIEVMFQNPILDSFSVTLTELQYTTLPYFAHSFECILF